MAGALDRRRRDRGHLHVPHRMSATLLAVLGAFMAVGPDVTERRNWIAVRGEGLLLASLALALGSASSHAAALSPGTAQAVPSRCATSLATGLWLGGLLPLALLLWLA